MLIGFLLGFVSAVAFVFWMDFGAPGVRTLLKAREERTDGD